MTRFIAAYLLVSTLSLQASEVDVEMNADRAKFNYQMFCQGCHVGTGIGGSSVPNMNGFVGNFLLSQEGREYLVRVPGSANSTLSDEYLAEVLNWMLISFSKGSLQNNWKPYNAKEVGKYRANPLYEVVDYRNQVIGRLPLN